MLFLFSGCSMCLTLSLNAMFGVIVEMVNTSTGYVH